MKPSRLSAALICLCLIIPATLSAVPSVLPYQGRLIEDSVNFTGTGYFKFALLDGSSNSVWSHDGTSSSGSEPSSFISSAVSQGFFNVNLGDTTLANMSALPPTVFENDPLSLRVWFASVAAGPYQQLSPDQRILSVAYSIMAGNVPDGSITSAKLASNALSNWVQSGSIDLGADIPFSLPTSTSFVTKQVTFSEPFQDTPMITATVQSGQSSVAQATTPLQISNTSPTGFEIRYPFKSLPMRLDRWSNTHQGIAPLAMIDGQPACAYTNASGRLEYARAADPKGETWPSERISFEYIGSRDIHLEVVSGNPAIAWRDTSGNIYFIRSQDVTGSSWGEAVTVHDSDSSGIAAHEISFAVIDGNPAFAFYEIGSSDAIYFIRASNSNGSTWPVSRVSVASGNRGIALADINGRPAISYPWDNGEPSNTLSYVAELRYIRADDNAGSSWPASPITLDSRADVFDRFETTALMEINSAPYVLAQFTLNGGSDWQMLYYSANDADGVSWDSFAYVSMSTSDFSNWNAGILNGQPTLSYHNNAENRIEVLRSNNFGGFYSTVVRIGTSTRFEPGLLWVDGQVALTYTDGEFRELRYYRTQNLLVGSAINWIATAP